MYENNIKDIIEVQNGNEEALNRLIEINSGLIWSIVRRFKDRGHEMDDLYQIAVIGFIKAVKRFDTDFEVKMSTYTVPYILGELKRFVRDDGPIKVSRSIKELLSKVRELQQEALVKGKELSISDLASKLNVSKEETVMVMESTNNVDSIYSEAYSDGDGNISILDKISTGRDEQTEVVNNIVLKNAIGELKDREKKIILLRYYKGKTQTEVAKILGITQVHVSRLERKALDEMKRKFAC
ncbi:MAG: sigma-70 family RNA polymerase sigma factor [Clostridia bacterium]|nr:sigma-70 family RNA polymerase sigma factor [Clostridia bacterium]